MNIFYTFPQTRQKRDSQVSIFLLSLQRASLVFKQEIQF